MGLFAAALAITAITVGCGSGGNSASTGSSPSGVETGSSQETTGGESSQKSTKAKSSGGSNSVQPSSLSKAQFITQASALCRREKAGLLGKTEAYLAEHSSEGLSQPVLYADAAKKVLMPVAEARIAGIRKLGAPAGDEEEVEAMLAGQEEGIERVRQLTTFVEGESLLPYFAQSNKAFEAYGLVECRYDL
jgi:hypothetical protein